MLERDAPYVQIIEHYRQEIREGRLTDGDMLPSGREIAKQFGVSLATAAKVAGGLQSIGLVTPRPGAGTMVTASRPPADRARGGPLLITLASRSPARPGDHARVLEAALAETVPDLLRKVRLTDQIAGFDPAWGEDWVSARPPTSAEAREFAIKRGSPVGVGHRRPVAAGARGIE